jgi:hypothetical protein
MCKKTMEVEKDGCLDVDETDHQPEGKSQKACDKASFGTFKPSRWLAGHERCFRTGGTLVEE